MGLLATFNSRNTKRRGGTTSVWNFYTLSCAEQQVYGTNDGCIRRGVVYRRKSMNTNFPLHTRNYFNFKEKLWIVVSYGCCTNEYVIYIFLMISCSSL